MKQELVNQFSKANEILKKANRTHEDNKKIYEYFVNHMLATDPLCDSGFCKGVLSKESSDKEYLAVDTALYTESLEDFSKEKLANMCLYEKIVLVNFHLYVVRAKFSEKVGQESEDRAFIEATVSSIKSLGDVDPEMKHVVDALRFPYLHHLNPIGIEARLKFIRATKNEILVHCEEPEHYANVVALVMKSSSMTEVLINYSNFSYDKQLIRGTKLLKFLLKASEAISNNTIHGDRKVILTQGRSSEITLNSSEVVAFSQYLNEPSQRNRLDNLDLYQMKSMYDEHLKSLKEHNSVGARRTP